MLFLHHGFRSRAVLYYLLQWICARWNHNRATLSSFVSQTLCNSLVTESKYYRTGGGFRGRGGCVYCVFLWEEKLLTLWKCGMRYQEFMKYCINLCIMEPNSCASEGKNYICIHLKGSFLNRGNISVRENIFSFTKNEGHGWVITCFGKTKTFFTILSLEVKTMELFSLRRARDFLYLITMSDPFIVTAKAGRWNTEMLVDYFFFNYL